MIGFDWESHVEHLKALGCNEDEDTCLWLDIQKYNDSETFEQLLAAIRQIIADMEDTAKANEGKDRA